MAFKMRSPLHNGDNKSKTPTIDKFMKMNERPKANELSYLDKVKHKHKIVKDALGPVVSTLTGISNLDKVGGIIAPMVSPKSGPKSIIEGPSKRDIQEQKRKQEKAAESAAARHELPAPSKMASPLNKLKIQNPSNIKANLKGVSDFIDSNTGAIIENEGSSSSLYDSLADKIEGTGEERSLNPAQAARKKGRDERTKVRREETLKRQTERAKNINLRNFGNEAGLTQDEIKEKEFNEFKDKFDEKQEQNKSLTLSTPTLDPSNLSKPKLSLMNMEDDTPMEMQPNRAGRPLNSNMLMTSPVIKTVKHSAKDAVAKLRMRNIAQSE